MVNNNFFLNYTTIRSNLRSSVCNTHCEEVRGFPRLLTFFCLPLDVFVG